MTNEQLQEIKAKYEEASETYPDTAWWTIRDDIPALVAEVERLQAVAKYATTQDSYSKKAPNLEQENPYSNEAITNN